LEIEQPNSRVKGVLASLFGENRRGDHSGDLRLVYREASATELLHVRADNFRRWSIALCLQRGAS
jgi:hypothetical protein